MRHHSADLGHVALDDGFECLAWIDGARELALADGVHRLVGSQPDGQWPGPHDAADAVVDDEQRRAVADDLHR